VVIVMCSDRIAGHTTGGIVIHSVAKNAPTCAHFGVLSCTYYFDYFRYTNCKYVWWKVSHNQCFPYI